MTEISLKLFTLPTVAFYFSDIDNIFTIYSI